MTTAFNAQANFNFAIASRSQHKKRRSREQLRYQGGNSCHGRRFNTMSTNSYVTLQLGADRLQRDYKDWTMKIHADGQWASIRRLFSNQNNIGNGRVRTACCAGYSGRPGLWRYRLACVPGAAYAARQYRHGSGRRRPVLDARLGVPWVATARSICWRAKVSAAAFRQDTTRLLDFWGTGMRPDGQHRQPY